MKFVLFYHSLVSDWNHGNAHFLRGIVRELMARGHEVARATSRRTAGAGRNLLRGPRRASRSPSSRQRSRAARRPPTICRASISTSARRRRPGHRPRVERARARRRGRPAPRRRRRLPAAVPRHAPPRRVGARTRMQAFELDALRRRAGVRRSAAGAVSQTRLGAPRLDLARGRRHATVPADRP